MTALPGPVACVTALSFSGQATRRFCFEAFLPKDKKERAYVLEELKLETRTIILYEAPHHLKKTLEELLDAIGDRDISICRELTKRFEEVKRQKISDAIAYYENQDPRGEYVLVIEGKNREEMMENRQKEWMEMPLEEHMEYYLSKGVDKKEAMKIVAKDRGLTKREIYKALLEE